MIRAAILAAVLALACEHTRAAGCIIVTNGRIENYMHELAHCNGWDHPAFQPDYDPPLSYVRPYAGHLTVYLAGTDYQEQMSVLDYAQMDAQYISMPNRTPPQLCGMLWKQHGIIAAQRDVDRIIGCAIRQ